MNSFQFLATNVARAVDSQPLRGPTDPAAKDQQPDDLVGDSDIVARPLESSFVEESQQDTSSSWFMLVMRAIFFFPNLLVISPMVFVCSLLLFPFKVVLSYVWGTPPDSSPENESAYDEGDTTELLEAPEDPQLEATKAYATGITTITEDDIEFDMTPHAAIPDDQLKSPTTVPYRSVQSSGAGIGSRKRRSRFLFPRLLINNNFKLDSPPSMPRKTLVLDLDETLIHSLSRHNSSVLGKSKGAMVEIRLSSQLATLYYIYKRPYVEEFLAIVRKWYNLVCFTASIREYADPVIDYLESEVLLRSGNDREFFKKKVFQQRYYRNNCIFEEGKGYIKDLDVLVLRKERSLKPNRSAEELVKPEETDLSKVVIIDNSPISYSRHRDNGIMVEGWINDPNDVELMNLLPLLNSLRFTSDVRSVLSLKEGQITFEK
ncbi:unnamed protein product [Kuraishia capsulata CBS 1993]|uniref:Mitochondrial import inner membrane translocase subunit TIM50 n=1 Tax=Kuraishia capsulata CBS 1993 TaxID=1382522 RepID=W6MLH6_9ASCO|nr:uncharacterized protein KUCA_T00003314001 [Kuraishia capsulata CBS 1993]CDK27336.1 unnamed protein product [Kuraishia capsulata CBS 1993]